MIKKILITLFLFFTLPQADAHIFNLMTFPKSGTHLVKKLLFILSEELGYEKAKCYHFAHFRNGHDLGYNPNVLISTKIMPTLLVIRDFRDVVVSLSHWHDKRIVDTETGGRWPINFVPKAILEEWKTLSETDKITALIEGFHPEALHFGNMLQEQFHHLHIFLKQASFPCIIRFENLVGPHGGGTLEAQVEEIQKIAEAIGIHLSLEDISYICDHLFGLREVDYGTDHVHTFRQGQIGGWKTTFTEEQITQFKKKYNHYLIEFGYETDDQW